MQFARKRKQKHCVLFDAHSDHSKSVNHYKNERKTEKMQQYLIYLTRHRGAGSTHKPSEPTKTASFWDTSRKKTGWERLTKSVEAHEYGMTVTEHGCMRDAMIPRIPTTHEADGKRWKHK